MELIDYTAIAIALKKIASGNFAAQSEFNIVGNEKLIETRLEKSSSV